MNSINCGQALVRLLEQHGVDTVFGIPGTHTLELYRGLAQSRIRHVQPRHEQGAGFMADGYARASGRPGVCFLIAGPGLLNAATPIAQAYSDSIPMLVVSSVADPTASGVAEGHIHELPNQGATMTGLTAFSATLSQSRELPDLLARAFACFNGARPRPVHIALPLALMGAPADLADVPVSSVGLNAKAVDRSLVAEAASLLRAAEHPVLILGGGAIEASAAAVTLAERIDAPILTTIAGKGIVADDHPLHAGAALTTVAGRRLAEEADVVLALGTELAASDTWAEKLTFAGKLIRVDIDTLAHRSHPDAAVAVEGDVGTVLDALLQHPPAHNRAEGAARAARCREESRRPPSALQARHLRALEALRAAIPGDAMVAADMAQVAYTANVAFPCFAPRGYFYPVGLSTMGYALPAAVGAKLAAPERAAVALTGDGGFLFTAAELGTAVEWGLPIVVLLWNNNGFGQIRDRMAARNIPPIGVNPRNPDLLALARAFGCRTARPASVAGLEREIRAALRRRVPTVIEIHDDGAWLA